MSELSQVRVRVRGRGKGKGRGRPRQTCFYTPTVASGHPKNV